MTVLDQCALEKQTNKQTEKKKNKTKQKHFFEECTGFCFLVNGSPIIKKKQPVLTLSLLCKLYCSS